MKYNFETAPDRRGTGAFKWNSMYEAKPDVSDGVIPFSVADMEFQNPQPLLDGMAKYVSQAVYGYTGPTHAYYESVINYMKRRHNWDIQKDWIITTPGVVPALNELVKAFSDPGDGVIITRPVYYPFSMAIENSGRKLVNVSLINRDGHYEMDFEGLEKAAKDPTTKLMILCSPHNPIGRVWTEEELRKLASICNSNGVMILSDEIHFDFVFPGHKHTVLATLSDEIAQNNIFCTAPSKTFNLGGVQVSNIIIPNPKLRERYNEYHKSMGMLALNMFAYKIGELVYNTCGDWFEELMQVLDTNRKLVEQYITTYLPQIKVIPLEGTYLQWLDCRALGMSGKELETFMQEKAELFLDEGYIFGEEGDGFERWNLACPTKYIQEGLERLRKAVEAL